MTELRIEKEGKRMSLAVKLKNLRLKKGKSLQDVASAVGSSKSHIWGLEVGRTKNPSSELLAKLADFFDIPVSNIIGENPNSPDEDPKLVAIYRNLKELSEDDRETIKLLIERLKKTNRESTCDRVTKQIKADNTSEKNNKPDQIAGEETILDLYCQDLEKVVRKTKSYAKELRKKRAKSECCRWL